MKKVLILLALSACFIAGANAQREQANWNAATYYANDSTTFFLSAAKGVKLVYVDYSTLDADDAVLKVGAAGTDVEGTGYLTWSTGGTTTADSLIMDATTNSNTIRKSDGTRYTNSRSYFWFSEGLPSDWIAVTIVWNSVTSGRVKLYF